MKRFIHRFSCSIIFLFVLAGLVIPDGFAAGTDCLYMSILGRGERHNPGWAGMELGVESDQWSPHDIFGGVLAMGHGSEKNSEFDAAYRVSGFGGMFLGYRLRRKGLVSPFLGVSGLQSFPGVEDSYFSLNPECGISVRLGGPYELGICGRYYFTTAGRNQDLWSVGFGLSRRCR